MKILSTIQSYLPDASRPLVLAFGNFDGLHAAHQVLVRRVVERARAIGGLAAILTFLEHPQQVLHPGEGPRLLNSLDYRLILLEREGVECCFLLHFTPELASTEAGAFVRNVLVKQLQVHEVYLGYNARFGKDRLGDAALMRRIGKEKGFHFEEIEPVETAGSVVSSSRIRKLVDTGNLEEAFDCLGRPYGFLGSVIQGDGRGRKLGFPTANLEVISRLRPPLGVYPVRVREIEITKDRRKSEEMDFSSRVVRGWHQGLLNYGLRPTFKGPEGGPVPEVHLLDFEGDLYGKTLEVVLLKRLRSEMAFSGPEELREQIGRDVKEARKAFKAQSSLQE